jgi:hypothetical protein
VTACYVLLRLPHGVKDLFADWLSRHHNGGEKVLSRIRGARGGALNDARFGMRMSGEGPWAVAFDQLFHVTRQRVGLDRPLAPLSADAFRRPVRQPTLF